MQRIILGLLICIGLAGCGASVQQSRSLGPGAIPVGGSLYVVHLDSAEYLLFLDGEITGQTSYVFQSIVETDEVQSLIVANSQGGQLFAAHQIGRTITANGIHTAVLGACVSACVDIFIAGRTREMAREAELFMHPANDRKWGYALDKPYWTALGFGAVNEKVYAMKDGQLWKVNAQRAIGMRLATGYLEG